LGEEGELNMLATITSRRNSCSLGIYSLLLSLLAACGGEQDGQLATVSAPAAKPVAESQPLSQEERAERERNKAVVASFMDVLGDPAAEQEFLADDYQLIRGEFHNLSYNAAGSELADMSDDLQVAIPDRNNEVVELIGEGSTVVVQYQIQGTHQGNLHGIPASGNSIDVEAVAILELVDGEINDGWFMLDEVRLLTQLGTIMPSRADGQIIVPPTNVATRTGDEILAEALANPVDSQEYRNKLKVNAYKAKNAPEGMYPVKDNGRPYNIYTRRGFLHLADFAKEPAKSEFPMGGAFPDRVDRIATLIADGDKVVIRFLLTATNTQSLFGIPATNRPVGGWEVGIMTFNGDDWDLGWWFGDDHGMLSQLGGSPDYFAADDPVE
jgi:predicted ester cyclase